MAMTWEKLGEKYADKHIRDFGDDNMYREYVNDCFDAYENDGFADTFGTPYAGEKKHMGKKFKVIGRVPEFDDDHPDGADLDCLPMWKIKLDTGEIIDAFPEEICNSER